MIIFALSAGMSISIGDLFMAGVIPGLMIALSLMLTIFIISKVKGYGKEIVLTEEELKIMTAKGRLRALKRSSSSTLNASDYQREEFTEVFSPQQKLPL